MNYFTNLIAKNYLEYTKEKDDNIALIFYQDCKTKSTKYTENQFFTKLILKLENFIEDTNFKLEEKPAKTFTEEDYYIAEQVKRDEEFMLENEATYMLYCEQEGIPYTPPKRTPVINLDECEDAEKLTWARSKGIDIKDPFTVISINKKKSKKELVLRKSKLEYLKSEAIRARDANNIEEIDVESFNKKQAKEDVSTLTSLSDIKETVIKHFQFTLDNDDRKNKQMLSQEEFLKLVSWVTYFLENNYELPNIDNPIMEVHIGKTKIKSAFKNLIHLYHPKRPKPKSFYTLVSNCFYALKDETEDSIQKTSDPDKPVN